jgi:putative hydrolase of the HAD superfamily
MRSRPGSLTRTELVLFDVGDTLVCPRQPFAELLQEIAEGAEIVLPAGAERDLGDHIDARIAERGTAGLPFTFPPEASARFWHDTYLGFLSQALPQDRALHLADSLRARLSSPAGYTTFPETVKALRALHEAGYRLGVVSNWEAWLPELLDSEGLTSWFDTIVVSGMCGIEKPDSRIFSLALEMSGVQPDIVVYVGDRPAHDVGPAWQAGIRPVLLDRHDRYPRHDAWKRIRSLTELPVVL